jgi:hypothetical protein
MPITTSFKDGHIEEGEDKRIAFIPKDRQGSAITPSAITLTMTDPTGRDTTKSKADFSQSGDEWYLYFRFDEDGEWDLDLKVTGPNSRIERVSESLDAKRA